MNEKEKMLAGLLYDPSKDGLPEIRKKAHDLCREYNLLSETDSRREILLQKLLPGNSPNSYFQGPIQFDYGCFTKIGKKTVPSVISNMQNQLPSKTTAGLPEM